MERATTSGIKGATGTVTTTGEEDVTSSIRLMADKHSVVRLHLQKAQKELAEKSKLLKLGNIIQF